MAIAFVQSGTARATGAVSKAFTSNNTAGNLIVVAIALEHNTDTLASVADTRSNTYAIAGILQGSGGVGYQVAIYYAKNIGAGANTVTVTPTTGTTPTNIAIHEYSGADTAVPLDQVASATGISTTPSSGSATTTAANELVFGVFTASVAVTVDASLTTRHDFTFNVFSYSVDKIVGAAGAYAVNGTMASNGWAVAMATFKPFVAAAGPSASYAEFLASEMPAAVVLAEIQPAEQLGPFALESGVVYRAPWSDVVQTSIVPGGLYRRLDVVRENAATYTAVGSISASQALAGSYYFDATADLIYVHTTSGSSPNVYEFIGAWFTIFLSTTTVTLDGQPLYQPLVSGLPTLESEMPDPLFGAAISSTGDLSVANTDGVFDALSKRWIWRNKIVRFKLGGTALAYSDFATVATMRINGLNVDDDSLVLQLEDTSAVLNQTLPSDSWTAVGTDGRTSAPKPLVFGTVADCPCVFLGHDTVNNRDLWAGFDFFLNNVTVVSVAAIQRETGLAAALVSGTHYNVDVASGFIRVTDATYFSSAGFDIIATLQDAHPATFGSIAHRILNRANELDGNIDLAAFDAADLAAPQLLGRYVNVPLPAADLMRELEQSCLGQVYRGIDGRWTCRVLDPSLPASVSLADADVARWDAVGDFSAVLTTVRVRYGYHPFGDVWLTTSASSSDVQYGGETFDSHQVDTWLTTVADAGVLASRLLFWYSTVPANIALDERGLTLMASQVGDLVSVTRSRAPVARTGRYDGQLLRILKLTKSLGVPSVSCVLGDLGGRADQIARLADFSLTWSTATPEQRALYGFLADSNAYLDPTDVTTRNLKVVV